MIADTFTCRGIGVERSLSVGIVAVSIPLQLYAATLAVHLGLG